MLRSNQLNDTKGLILRLYFDCIKLIFSVFRLRSNLLNNLSVQDFFLFLESGHSIIFVFLKTTSLQKIEEYISAIFTNDCSWCAIFGF